MKPNFDEMSKAELKAYVLSHRDDDEAIHALFSRRNPPDSEAIWYGPLSTPEGVPIEENISVAEEAIRQRAERDSEALLRSPLALPKASADREKPKNKEKKSYKKKENWRQGLGRKLRKKSRKDSDGRFSKNGLVLRKTI